MKKSFWAVIAILAVIVIGIGWFISSSNSIIRVEEEVNAAWAEVDNQLQRRYDLIPNLVNTVKGYAAHEEDIYIAIAEARSQLAGAATPEETMEASGQMESALSRLLVVVENYPTLKADESFRDLTYELSGTENRIAVARSRYNETVREFNVKIRTFPTSIVASMKNVQSKSMFEAVSGSSTPPIVSFD